MTRVIKTGLDLTLTDVSGKRVSLRELAGRRIKRTEKVGQAVHVIVDTGTGCPGLVLVCPDGQTYDQICFKQF